MLICSDQTSYLAEFFHSHALMCLRCPHAKCPVGLEGRASYWVSHSCANNQSQAMASGLRPAICVHVLLGLRGNTFP